MGTEKRRRLDARERRFVDEYIVDLDPKRAALAAGYSLTMAESKAYQWVSGSKSTKPHVQAAVDAAKAKRASETSVSAKRVLEELALIAFADIGEVITCTDAGVVTVRPLEKLRPETRRAIGEISQRTTEVFTDGGGRIEKVTTTVRHHSKVAALRMLMDHLGMDAPKRSEHTGKDGGPIETAARVRYVVTVPPDEPDG